MIYTRHPVLAPGAFLLLLYSMVNLPTACLAGITLHEIPPLAGRESSKSYGINNAGTVCGKSFTSDSDDLAMTWSQANGATLLASLDSGSESSCWDINDAGQASGFSRQSGGARHSVRWENQQTVTDLGTLMNPSSGIAGSTSEGYGIASDGTITGLAEITNNTGETVVFHAVKADGQTLTDLGTLNDADGHYQYGYSIAYAVSDYGETVGTAQNNDLLYRPFIHDAAGGIAELPVNTAHAEGEWYATGITDGGIISGHVIATDGHVLPLYWPCRNCEPEMIPLPAGFANAEIYAINEAGQMVGMMWSDDAEPVEHAFIFDEVFGLRDLNQLISANTDWTLTFARDINDKGQIVGTGIHDGVERGYMLDNLDLNTPGDYTNDGTIDIKDAVAALQLLTGVSQTPLNLKADVNNDKQLGLAEVIYTLNTTATL